MSTLNPLRFYLFPQPQATIFTGRVASTPSDPYISISFNTGVTGAFGDPLPGMTVHFGTTSGGSERGKRRLRSFSGAATGTIKIDESDDVGPLITASDYITVKADMRLWPKYPRFIQNGTNVIIREDYDVDYTNQTSQWRPRAVAGPPGVAFLEAGQAQISFVGEQSHALAPGASITNYLWTATDSSEGTSTSQGTEASPVVFTWTSPGWYLVSLKVTDSNGQNHTNYTWAVVDNPDNPSYAITSFDVASDGFDFQQGGGECSFSVESGNATVSDFPEECLVLHVARGTQTTPTASWPHRTNLLFAGYVLTDTVRQNPDNGDVSFRAGTIDAIMRNLSMFPVSLTNTSTPVEWTQGKQLTVDRCASFLYKWRSTLDAMASIIPTGDTRLIWRQDFGPTDLYSMVQNELVNSILGKVVSTPQGVLYHIIDYNVQNATERATAMTRKAINKATWVGDVYVEEKADYQWQARQVKMSGIYYNGGDIEEICPLFSEAPGDAPKSYGKESNFDRLILSGQTDLNVRCGHMLAKLTQRYGPYRMSFLNDGSFGSVPQDLFPTVIESGDNDRNLAFSGNLIARRISRSYDHTQGFYRVDVDFEPESSGQPGATVDIPCGPPEQKLPSTITPTAPGGAGAGETALALSTTGSSFYFAQTTGVSWERRVNGLADPAHLGFVDMIPDPWSEFKQGYNPNRIIIWGSGQGFLVRSEDTGQSWGDRTNFLTAPGWDGDAPVDISEITFMRLVADIFTEDQIFMLAQWQVGGQWRAAVGKSTDGFEFSWLDLDTAAQARPLGMSLDRGNGATLWVTTWDSEPTGTINLNKINVSDLSLAATYSLGQASSAQVDAQIYYATPYNRLGQTDEVFVYGRMNNPQVNSGTVHVLLNDNAGATGSYTVIENGWGQDLCGSFGADEAGYYYAIRNI